MTEYRDRTTGEIKSQGQLRKENPNMSMPKVWNTNVFDALNVDPVFPSAKPPIADGEYKVVVRNGVEQDNEGNWVQAWVLQDMFSSDENGTKAEKEAAYQRQIDDRIAFQNRDKRDGLLSETDWMALSDVTMSAEMAAYRQALRDITAHANWPHLNDEDWPTKP